jgi:glycyl-tRNA synthetase alpha subunit
MIGIRSANGSNEKEKMRTSLRVIVEELMQISGYDDMLAMCHKINLLDETQVDQICQNDYYDLKIRNEFYFKRNPEEEEEAKEED